MELLERIVYFFVTGLDVKSESLILNDKISNRYRGLALIFALFLGGFGAHKFYLGLKRTAILYICTLGFFGIGVAIDIILILFGMAVDVNGDALKRWVKEN